MQSNVHSQNTALNKWLPSLGLPRPRRRHVAGAGTKISRTQVRPQRPKSRSCEHVSGTSGVSRTATEHRALTVPSRRRRRRLNNLASVISSDALRKSAPDHRLFNLITQRSPMPCMHACSFQIDRTPKLFAKLMTLDWCLSWK
jgi:hypothetical protein